MFPVHYSLMLLIYSLFCVIEFYSIIKLDRANEKHIVIDRKRLPQRTELPVLCSLTRHPGQRGASPSVSIRLSRVWIKGVHSSGFHPDLWLRKWLREE
jgi:hypothetical protein